MAAPKLQSTGDTYTQDVKPSLVCKIFGCEQDFQNRRVKHCRSRQGDKGHIEIKPERHATAKNGQGHPPPFDEREHDHQQREDADRKFLALIDVISNRHAGEFGCFDLQIRCEERDE